VTLIELSPVILSGIAIGIVLVAAILLFIFSLPSLRSSPRSLRPIPAVQRLRRAIGLAVEEGKGLHVSLGKANLLEPPAAITLAGLSTLERITQSSMISDRPPVTTSGDPAVSILSQDTMRGIYRSGNVLESFDPAQANLVGASPVAYIAGTLPVAADENEAAHILVGSFGPEVGLLTDQADATGSFTIGGSESLPAQAVLYATAQQPLLGEEVFALPAYLGAGSYHQASLRVQDWLRWGIVVVLIVGTLLSVALG
jgi:hypothetical protein